MVYTYFWSTYLYQQITFILLTRCIGRTYLTYKIKTSGTFQQRGPQIMQRAPRLPDQHRGAVRSWRGGGSTLGGGAGQSAARLRSRGCLRAAAAA